jgi:DNA-binding Xre family transcriptional regulator
MLRLTVREVAEKAGIRNALELSQQAKLPYESVRRIWQGKTEMIALRTLERLCQVLQVPPAQLFEYKPEQLPQTDDTKPKRKRDLK